MGIKKQKYGEHWFNLNIDVTQYEKNKDKENSINSDNKNEININSYFSKDNSDFEIITGQPTFSYEEIKTINKYPKLNHWELFLEKNKNKYPFIISELEKLNQIDNEKLDLIEISKNDTIYIGEADYIIRTGRGAMIFQNEGMIYIGYWDNGRQFKKGKIFDLNNNLIYDGEYKNGLKDGYGVYYYSNGDKYEGKFCEGLREGKGTFYWKDGTRWEGYFKNDEMNGEGVFYDGKKSYNVLYQNGELMDN